VLALRKLGKQERGAPAMDVSSKEAYAMNPAGKG